MNTTQELTNADNGFAYLQSRFLRKDKSYFDCDNEARTKYSIKDLLGILRSKKLHPEAVHTVARRLSAVDLAVWSGREVFRPNQPRIIPNADGTSDINTWKPSEVEPSDGDATPFLDYLGTYIPINADREYLLDVLAYRYQNPMDKQQHGVCIYSKEHGIGKSMLKTSLMPVFGNTKTAKDLNGLVGPFAAPNWGGSLLFGEEIPVRSGSGHYNALKSYITESTQLGQRKGQDWTTFETPATLILLTNQEPSFIEAEDRRLFIIEARTKLAKSEIVPYMARFDAWLKDGGYEAIAGFLAARDVSDYSPYRAPPVNATKERLIGLVGSGIGQDVMDWIDDRQVFTQRQITDAFRDQRIGIDRIRHYLDGYAKFVGTGDGRVTIKGSKEWVWHRTGTRIVTQSGSSSMLVLEDGTEVKLAEAIESGRDDDTL